MYFQHINLEALKLPLQRCSKYRISVGLSTGNNIDVTISAGYRVLLTINQQCKLWRTKYETDSVPINTANHVALWKMLIDRNLPNYFNLKESQPVIVINAALEAIRNVLESHSPHRGWVQGFLELRMFENF